MSARRLKPAKRHLYMFCWRFAPAGGHTGPPLQQAVMQVVVFSRTHVNYDKLGQSQALPLGKVGHHLGCFRSKLLNGRSKYFERTFEVF